MIKLEKFIQWGLLVIVALMPVHAFLSVSLGHAFGNQTYIQAWKEVLLLILAAAAVLLVIREPERLRRLRQPWILAAGAFIVLGLITTAIFRPEPLATAFGLKTNFGFLLAAFLAVLCASQAFVQKLIWVVLAGAAVVTGFGLVQIFLLPPNFLEAFGYGPDTILPYHYIAAGSDFLRFPSTLGGPNQLGTYLILPLCLSLALFIKNFRQRHSLWYGALFIACLICLFYTFSRGAWLGATAALALTLAIVLPAKLRRPAAITGAILLIAVLSAIPYALQKDSPLQYLILHSSVEDHHEPVQSDSLHALSLQDGVEAVIDEPLGHGLGTAGPATFHVGETNIIENYYLQLGYEIGLLAILLFLFCCGALVWTLLRYGAHSPLALAAAATVVGVSVVSIVLPAWVDSTTALITWITAGAVTGIRRV